MRYGRKNKKKKILNKIYYATKGYWHHTILAARESFVRMYIYEGQRLTLLMLHVCRMYICRYRLIALHLSSTPLAFLGQTAELKHYRVITVAVVSVRSLVCVEATSAARRGGSEDKQLGFLSPHRKSTCQVSLYFTALFLMLLRTRTYVFLILGKYAHHVHFVRHIRRVLLAMSICCIVFMHTQRVTGVGKYM